MLATLKSIGSWIRACDEEDFRRMLAAYPDLRVYNARTERVPECLDGLLLTGGEDISSSFLRQPVPNPKLIEGANPERDQWEFAVLARALEARRPILAICRGLQVLNVARGGTLHLDIPGHDHDRRNNVQPLRYADDATVRFEKVNSSHHQSLDRLGDGLRVEAWHARDGTIEQARLEDYPFALGAQYHPERDELYRPFFDAFAEQLLGRPAWT